MKKIVSHFQKVTTPWVKTPVRFANEYQVADVEETVVDGRVSKKSVIKVVRPSEKFAGMKVSDFALENIIAAGALDMLKPVMLHDDSHEAIDMVDSTLDSIMNQIDTAVVAEEPKNNEE